MTGSIAPIPVAGLPGRWHTVANAVAFQLGWFACVIGAARGWAGWGTALAAAIVAVHVAGSGRRWRAEAAVVAATVAIGAAWDSAMLHGGAMAYAAPGPWTALAPPWILALWAMFACTLNVSMRWLRRLPLPAVALLGAVAGPLSYLAGARLGACTMPEPKLTLTVLAIGWAVLTPALVVLAGRLERRLAPVLEVRA